MNNIIVIFGIGLIVFFGCTVDSQTKKVDLELEKEKVELVLEKYVIANEKQDIELIYEIWAAEPDIVVFGTNSDEKII